MTKEEYEKEHQNKKLFWGKKLWRKNSTKKNSLPIEGALSIVGKDIQGRKIIYPARFFELTRKRIRKVSVSNEITADYMINVLEKLAPYTIRNNNNKSVS